MLLSLDKYYKVYFNYIQYLSLRFIEIQRLFTVYLVLIKFYFSIYSMFITAVFI